MKQLKSLKKIPGIKGIDHIGIAVFSLDQAIDFYELILGAQLLHKETNHEQNVAEAILDLNGTMIQLLAPLSENGAVFDFLKRRGPGIQQIALTVEDIELACSVAKANGISVVYSEHKAGTLESKINFLHPKNCEGVLFELVERKVQ